MSGTWIHPFIILGGILKAAGAPINGELKGTHRFGIRFIHSSVSRFYETLASTFFIRPHSGMRCSLNRRTTLGDMRRNI